MFRRDSFFLPTAFGLFAIGTVLFLTRLLWLPLIGHALIQNDGPAKADLVVVLAGDFWGNRIIKAGDLVRQGYAPAALISGPGAVYGQHECDLAIAYAVLKGYPAEWFIPFPNDARSTQDEALVILPDLARRNVHRILLVTSDYHTGRAGRIFRSIERSLKGGIEIRVVASPDKEFRPDAWWQTRQGRKIAFDEWTRTMATAAGL